MRTMARTNGGCRKHDGDPVSNVADRTEKLVALMVAVVAVAASWLA